MVKLVLSISMLRVQGSMSCALIKQTKKKLLVYIRFL